MLLNVDPYTYLVIYHYKRSPSTVYLIQYFTIKLQLVTQLDCAAAGLIQIEFNILKSHPVTKRNINM